MVVGLAWVSGSAPVVRLCSVTSCARKSWNVKRVGITPVAAASRIGLPHIAANPDDESSSSCERQMSDGPDVADVAPALSAHRLSAARLSVDLLGSRSDTESRPATLAGPVDALCPIASACPQM